MIDYTTQSEAAIGDTTQSEAAIPDDIRNTCFPVNNWDVNEWIMHSISSPKTKTFDSCGISNVPVDLLQHFVHRVSANGKLIDREIKHFNEVQFVKIFQDL